MSPLTRTYVKRHRLDPKVFREAARFHAELSEQEGEWANGACYALRKTVGLENPARFHYYAFFTALMSGTHGHGSLYYWPLRSITNEHESTTPRLIALELCVLVVENLRK